MVLGVVFEWSWEVVLLWSLSGLGVVSGVVWTVLLEWSLEWSTNCFLHSPVSAVGALLCLWNSPEGILRRVMRVVLNYPERVLACMVSGPSLFGICWHIFY